MQGAVLCMIGINCFDIPCHWCCHKLHDQLLCAVIIHIIQGKMIILDKSADTVKSRICSIRINMLKGNLLQCKLIRGISSRLIFCFRLWNNSKTDAAGGFVSGYRDLIIPRMTTVKYLKRVLYYSEQNAKRVLL